MNHTHNVVINYWDDWAYNDAVGIIANVSKDQKQIKLETDDGEYVYIEVDCLRSVVIL
ncbi:hypothetical protein J2S05_000859 [Alkalicoccobacillus murimartini]|uniref:Uncharacterized protein n=1 Tax=Alkalicoccobacillus murimartini TaxID=171685 RepID=A0ABT9YF03_9BACI|nr:hypothetical protein [Alkalicoccobacillus murimartini]